MLGEIGSKWLDRLHQQIAKDLRAKGWSQVEIADILGTTQSTISRQIMKKPVELNASADESTVDGWAHELSQALITMGPQSNVIRQRLVLEFQFAGNNTLRFDKTLTGMDLDVDQEQRSLLRRLEWAVGRLDIRKISSAMPAVGLNIASALADAKVAEDVAAFPGKIIMVDGKLRHHETPSFGASTHLANLLLQVMEMDSEKVAILNIRPPMLDNGVDVEKVSAVCDDLGYKLTVAPKGVIEKGSSKVDILLDVGAFGWEPSLYILAHNPLELIDRCHQVLSSF
jgi:predicted fused transcriptional regulator/phosphomethylpyrimidine kinase/predicted transcriptional regulator